MITAFKKIKKNETLINYLKEKVGTRGGYPKFYSDI